MEVQDSVTIKPKIHDLSAFKQIMESRSHPLDMVREALSNMMAPEAIPQKSPCQPNLLECSRLGTRFQVPILYALTLLARVSQVETLCPHRVSFALLP